MQNQKSSGFGFSWGSISSSFTFLPRLTYKDIVLSKAQWNILRKDFEQIFSDKATIVSSVRTFAKNQHLPDIVVLAEGDNEILINFKNDLSCTVFYDMVKSKQLVSLHEFLMENTASTDGYANEFIAFATKNEIAKQTKPIDTKINASHRNFSIGSDWVYYKFYCGHSSAEEVLKKAIAPVIQELQKDKVIDKWFFIRFNDKDGHHLRLRIKLLKANDIFKVTSAVHRYLKYFTNQKIVWKMQLDTYVPEAERYGDTIMNETELAFQYDSESILKFIDMIEGDEGEKVRWLFSLLSIDTYLDDFGLSEKEKMSLLKIAKDGFGSEFEKDKSSNKKINALYNDNIDDVLAILENTDDKSPYVPLQELVKNRSAKIKSTLEKIKKVLDEQEDTENRNQVLISHVHMICNRLFLTKQREHEAVVYDLLYQYFRRKAYR